MLKEFFQPLPTDLTSSLSKSDLYLENKCSKHIHDFPELSPGTLAFFGFDESADAIRKSFYQLSNQFSDIEIADLGNLKIKANDKNALAGYRELFHAMIELGVQPVCVGMDHLILIAYLEMLSENTAPDVCLVTQKLSQPDKLLLYLENENKQKLFHLSLLGHQSHYNTESDYQFFDDIFTDSLRLGSLQSNLQKAEPLMRESDLIAFDLNALRYSDFKAANHSGPNGLYNEEACKLMRFAGMANKKMPLIIYGMNSKKVSVQDCDLTAQMLWYFLDGAQNRYADSPNESNEEFKLIRCPVEGMPISEIKFLQSLKSERIWMEIPLELINKPRDSKWIGCSETELEIASLGEVPEKWFRAIGWKAF
jgi:formiminoglutamase